jgi:hypothetical protein
MSVRWMRTGRIRDNKFLEAISWGKEVSAYVEKKTGGHKIQMWVDTAGEIGTVRWTMDLPDLATVEKIQTALLTDQTYWQMLAKSAKDGLFIDGSAHDVIYREV